ncbi:MAG: CCDC90 family protein [Desulfovibrio sp.]|jgi:hypothetical protein|nr:CCDC90 family protein [Desulfovibrio sp.]
MATTTFDTLGYFEKLISAGVPEQQAKVQADTMREVIEDRLANVDGNVATKADIRTLDAKIDMVETKLLLSPANQKHELLKWMIGIACAQAAFIVTLLRIMNLLK